MLLSFSNAKRVQFPDFVSPLPPLTIIEVKKPLFRVSDCHNQDALDIKTPIQSSTLSIFAIEPAHLGGFPTKGLFRECKLRYFGRALARSMSSRTRAGSANAHARPWE